MKIQKTETKQTRYTKVGNNPDETTTEHRQRETLTFYRRGQRNTGENPEATKKVGNQEEKVE